MGTCPATSCFVGYERKAKILTRLMIEETLKKYSKDGFLTLQNFNDCLSVLTFNENFPRLAYTYLSERLFNLLDSDNNGRIRNDEFDRCFMTALASQEYKAMSKIIFLNIYSIVMFEAMKTKKDKDYLTFEDIYLFFLQSWKYGFNYVFSYINYYFKQEFIKNNIPLPQSQNDFTNVIKRHSQDLHNYLVKNLYDSGININQQITYGMFSEWILKDNTTEITYAKKVFRFATSILFMENIGINEKELINYFKNRLLE